MPVAAQHLAPKPQALLMSALLLVCLAALTITPARAAEPSAGKSTAPSAASPASNTPALSVPGTTYLVKKNDTLDKLLASHYKASPLKTEVLRSAVLAANPGLGNGKAARLKPGSSLLLPDHGYIALGTLIPLVPEPALASLAPAPTPDPTARRDWVRYP